MTDVAVIGGCIAGCATAALLAEAGATVTLFERTLTTLEPRASTRTDPDGRFSFLGQKVHHLVLEARAERARSPRTAVRLWFRCQNVVLAEPLRIAP